MADQVGKAEAVKRVKIEGTGIQIILWKKGDKQYFTIEKQYKDKQSGDWKKSSYYFLEEVAKVRHCLQNDFPILDGIEITPDEDDDQPY